MPRRDADRNLLLGINALQNDFITRDALIGAMNAWILEKHRPIGELLVERGALKADDRALLEKLVDRHVELHGDDPAASLAAMSSVESIAAEIRRGVADPEVHESIAHVSEVDPHATRATETVDYFPKAVRYQKVREHAKGGLGVVFVARDNELNREVALKEIKPTYASNLGMRSRFLVEAEITGGLEHPGIVPVYGLGHDDAGQPFYAMRFIRGDSLKESIAAFHADKALKSDPGARTLALQKLLRRFLDVCNAIDYAHSRGVLHRDLKPANVMVGKYGETLVVDWGLAKSIGRTGDDSLSTMAETPLFATSSGSVETLPGSQVGTPAYMSPEQAAGRLDLLGSACDVYGLGATLYSLLTGKSPISGVDLAEILRKVEKGEFPPPRESSPWLDSALNAICLKAMALKPESRYASPRALADDIDRWLAGEPVLAYPEPLVRRARRWARRHRTGLTTAASTVAVAALLLGFIAGSWIAESSKAEASARAHLLESDAWAIRARASGNIIDWDHAINEAKLARDRLESAGPASLRSAVDVRLFSLGDERAHRIAEVEADHKDRAIIAAIEEAHLLGVIDIDRSVKDSSFKNDAYRSAFRAYGIDVLNLPVAEAAHRIRRSRVAENLIEGLYDWAFAVHLEIAGQLIEIAAASESDPIRKKIRDVIDRREPAALLDLCETEESRHKLGPLIRRVFDTLLEIDPINSFPVLEAILIENPSDFWMNHDLGMAFMKQKSSLGAVALRRLTAAIALRPDSSAAHSNFGYALFCQGELGAAVAEYRQAVRTNPNDAKTHYGLGIALHARGDLEDAVAEYREALRINPDFAQAHNMLGGALRDRGNLEDAVAEYRQALRINPDSTEAHINLGNALSDQGDIGAGVAEYHQALRIDPNCAEAHFNMGISLRDQGQIDAAISEYREVLRIKPDYAEAHYNLGITLGFRGQVDAAITEYRQAIRIKPDYAEAFCNLGLSLQKLGQLVESLENLEKGHALGLKRRDWRYRSEAWVREARSLVNLEPKLQAIMKGEAVAGRADDRVALAVVCYLKRMYATSARFWAEAFAERPVLAEDISSDNRYNAACSAAMAASGKGQDEPPLDASGGAKFRAQALAWLKADLSIHSKALDDGKPADCDLVAKTLVYWQADLNLAGIRDEASLAMLPEGERAALRTLWEDVGRQLIRAREGK